MNKQQIKKVAGLFTIIFACLLFNFSVVETVGAYEQPEEINVAYDNELNSRTPDTVKATSVYISIGRRIIYGDETMRYIGKLDVSSLDSAEMETAILTVDRVSTSWDGSGDYSLYKVNENWDSATVTWNNQPEIGATEISGGVIGSYGIIEFDISDLAKEWVDNPESNNGFVIMKSEESSIIGNESGLFASADYPEGGCETKPYLALTYKEYEPEFGEWTNPVAADASSFLYSQHMDNYSPEKAIDDDTTTWWFTESEQGPPSWISFDMGETKRISKVRAMIWHYEIPLTLNVQISDNNSDWTTIVSDFTFTEGDVFIEIPFDSEVDTRYIRLYETAYARVWGTCTEFDAYVVEELVPEIKGDLDHDGDVDYEDFRVFYSSWGSREGDPRFNPEADFDQNGHITFADYRYFIIYYREFHGL